MAETPDSHHLKMGMPTNPSRCAHTPTPDFLNPGSDLRNPSWECFSTTEIAAMEVVGFGRGNLLSTAPGPTFRSGRLPGADGRHGADIRPTLCVLAAAAG